jgi:hypothetical protein
LKEKSPLKSAKKQREVLKEEESVEEAIDFIPLEG